MNTSIASMTGFGRATREFDNMSVQCEIKSVNGRGFDLRARLSPGYDALENDLRRLLASRITRGSVTMTLGIAHEAEATEIVVNHKALESVLAAIDELVGRIDSQKPSIEAVLGLKGVLETRDAVLAPEAQARLFTVITDCVSEALEHLLASRQTEGARIAEALAARLDEIETLTAKAENHPARTRESILQRLREQVAQLAEAGTGLSEERLHQEAMILATKADIREEIDRLFAHITAARALLACGGPTGRKLDFLSQEFNREANTLCSKSNDVGLTAIGLDLKATIDQLREQVQNLE